MASSRTWGKISLTVQQALTASQQKKKKKFNPVCTMALCTKEVAHHVMKDMRTEDET